MADDMKRTSEYRRMLPFIAKASNDVGDDTQGEEVQALILALNTHKTSADHDDRYYTETESNARYSLLGHLHDDRYSLLGHLHDERYYTETETNTLLSYKADKTITLTAGNGLTGGGDLSDNRTFTVGQGFGLTVTADAVGVNLTSNYTWTGLHEFGHDIYTKSIRPILSDTYDLGDYNRIWRKIWGSELSAIVFAKYEQVLLGGWFTVSRGQGILPADIVAAQTQIDLGDGTFLPNDILVFRGSTYGVWVEYMKVGSNVSGTTYNVTRNLDGTGANDWLEGTVFANWGQFGNGRVELNAYNTPRMSVYSQGATYSDQKEQVRIGELSGNWGYGTQIPTVYGVAVYGTRRYGFGYDAEHYGAAFGSYEAGKANITIDPTNGIRIRNYNNTVIQLNGTQATFESTIYLGAAGKLIQGTGAWGTDFTGSAIWSEGSVMNVGGWNAGVKQWWGGSDGYLHASGGTILIGNLNGEWGYGLFYSTYGTAQYGTSRYGAKYDGAAFGAYAVGQANITIDSLKGIRIRHYNNTILQAGKLNDWSGGALSGIEGLAIGIYPTNWMTYDPINGLQVKGNIKAESGYLKDLSIDGTLTLSTAGKLLQGTGTWGSNFTGTAIWSESSVMNVGGWNAGVKQWWGGSDGVFHAGADRITIDNAGIKLRNDSAANGGLPGYIRFQSTDLLYDKIYMRSNLSGYLELNNLYSDGGIIAWVKTASGDTYNTRFFSASDVPMMQIRGVVSIGETASPLSNTGLLVRGRGNTAANFALQLQNSDESQLLYVNNAGNTWMVGNCSALSFTDRTPYFEGDALAAINKIKAHTNTESHHKEIDHSTLPDFVRVQKQDTEGKVTEERDLGAMISIMTVAIQQLDKKINILSKNGE